MKTTLTKMVLQYQKDKVNFTAIFQEVCRQIYARSWKTMRLEEEEIGEFILFFYQRLKSIACKYQYDGKPFEAYLFTSIKWQVKTFLKERIQQRIKDEVAKEQAIAHYISTEERPYQYSEAMDGSVVKKIVEQTRTNEKRLVYLLMKLVHKINDDLLDSVLERTTIDRSWLTEKVELMKQLIKERHYRQQILQEKRNAAHFLLQCFEKEMGRNIPEYRVKLLEKRIPRLKRRVEKISAYLEKCKTTPSNKEIAEVIGVPKGTVDSGLFYLKRDLICN